MGKKGSIKIGLMGVGTVGTGVIKVLLKNKKIIAQRVGAELKLTKIFDHDTQGVLSKIKELGLDGSLLTNDFQELVNDKEIDIIVEVIGGINPAREFIIQALEKGKSVVTANKDLIAAHGKDLFEAAALHQVDLFFEASVAGGIPIIQPLKESLAANQITQVMGIINGTTNFILTKMSEEKKGFKEVLTLAQDLGYAEADPISDVGGFDAARKLAILASIAFNTRITDASVYVEGIENISPLDITYAQELGLTIKLLGIAKIQDEEIEVRVHPAMIPVSHPLSSVNDVYNAVFVEGDTVGKTMFYGRGAGELPTASAIVGDLISAARNIQYSARGRLLCTCFEEKVIKPIGKIKTKFYLRMSINDQPGVLSCIAAALGNENVSIESVVQKRVREENIAEIVMITHTVTEENFNKAMDIIRELPSVNQVENVIRVEHGN